MRIDLECGACFPQMHIKLRNKCQSAPATSAIDAAKADWATALRVAASRGSGFSREFYPFATKVAPTGHYLRRAPRRAIDLASNAAHERLLEVPFKRITG